MNLIILCLLYANVTSSIMLRHSISYIGFHGLQFRKFSVAKTINSALVNDLSKYDVNDCEVIITAGVGGAEAFDWCKMLNKMYKRFISHYKHPGDDICGPLPKVLLYKEVDVSIGDSGGYRMVKFNVIGDYAYKLFKGEKGTHRLVRNSPFNSVKKRQTTFGGVQVVPILDDDDENVREYNHNKKLKDKDLIIESMRSDGKGGQNVNKVETAVRITHKPSGIAVKVQQERTNAQNKEIALERLAEKVDEYYKSILQEKINELQGDDVNPCWGKHMRSYILNPEQRFKDHRINYETQDVYNILEGELLPIMMKYLMDEYKSS